MILRRIKHEIQQNISLNSNKQQKKHMPQNVTLTYYNDKSHKIAQTFRKLKYKIAYRTNN